MIRAIIFDFDGLILETEGPAYRSWEEVYQRFGMALPFSTWSTIIGTSHGKFDPRLELEKQVKSEVDWEAVEAGRQAREYALIEGLETQPGVKGYLEDARRLGLKTGVASSSSGKWVRGHLTRLGLMDFFACICASDDVQHTKPDPELYRCVLRGLEVKAEEAIALEDSPNGIHAAKLAGIYCVAVPNLLTSQLNLEQADFRLDSLDEMPLEQLLSQVDLD